MSTRDLSSAVRAILPAFHFAPETFRIESGFVERALRRGRPAAVVLDDPATQLVFIGRRPEADAEAVADSIGAEALAALVGESRAVCERIIAAWIGKDERYLAAAWIIGPGGSLARRIAMSWRPPQEWPQPMFDPSTSSEAGLDDALRRIEAAVRQRCDSDATSRMARALRLVELNLRRVGGEGQDNGAAPSLDATEDAWAEWLRRYIASVRNEWSRATKTTAPRAGAIQRKPDGPLAGRKVFLSYARPDATTLAWPVRDALQECGASVWFDQERDIDAVTLDAGLQAFIRACDTYVMCLSDEFIERCGYATQECVWAMAEVGNESLRHFLIVSRPDAVIPPLLASWPRIVLQGDVDALAAALGRALAASPPVPPSPSPRTGSARTCDADVGALPPAADLDAMRDRVRHIRAFAQIDGAALAELIAQADESRHAARVRRRLESVAEELEWDGILAQIGESSVDPFVRDHRLRLGAARAVAGTRWGLSGGLSDDHAVHRDVEWLATEVAPILEWTAVIGWDDVDRRFALRSYAGILRVLCQLLRRGLTGGLIGVPSSRVAVWEREVEARRRECHDALLSIRLENRAGWSTEPPLWDALFRSWSTLLLRGPWAGPPSGTVNQVLAANAEELAAVAAHVAWFTSRTGKRAEQVFWARGYDAPRIRVFASPTDAAVLTAPEEHTLALGLAGSANGSAEVHLVWNGVSALGEARALSTGHSSAPASPHLVAAASFANA